MKADTKKNIKGPFSGRVCENKCIGQRHYRLKAEFVGDAAKILSHAKPGQFVQLKLSDIALPPADKIPTELDDVSKRAAILRRPFSFADIELINPDCTQADLFYSVLGPGTLRMTTLVKGDKLDMIGPLGNGFWVPSGKTTALLVAGGIGVTPLEHLAKFLKTNHSEVETIAFAGAKTVNNLPFEIKKEQISDKLSYSLPEFARLDVKSLVATDDGSAGFTGFVTDCVESWLDKTNTKATEMIVYACGPEPMLAKIAEIAQHRGIDCQVSLEKMMACGIGLCQSCAVETEAKGSKETIYKLCCKDGPVFDSKEVIW